jgi:PTH1 family peptidyl-tRNA hydrolase
MMAFRKLLGRDRKSLKADWLVVGLGNPGPEYVKNRHNVGFRVVNELARRAGVQPRSAGAVLVAGVGQLGGNAVALVKPLTFYNGSGKAVARALRESGCDLAHTIVVYDELDLPTGAVRIRVGGGHGGNNGLKSIQGLAGPDFIRVRIGIDRPSVDGKPTRDPDYVVEWVLGDPSGEERRQLDGTVTYAADAVEAIIADGPDAAGSRFNRR